jgi:lysophospholipase L1-like esterase
VLWLLTALLANVPAGEPPRLERPEALAPFYRRLAAIEDGRDEGIARVVHMGASSIGHDDLTSVLRRKFQTRFGDGGAGLVMMRRYMYNYRHRWVELRSKGWDDCFILYACKGDGHYGLGGVTFMSGGGATTRIKTRSAKLGGTAAHFEVWYAATRTGGKLDVRIDGDRARTLNARGSRLEDRFESFDVPEGKHEIAVQARGDVRAYGVVVESDGPGVVWDQFSMLAVPTYALKRFDEAHLAGQIARRNPDLIVLSYGGNDLERVVGRGLKKGKYVSEFTDVVERIRAGKPEAPCLIIGIAERRISKGRFLKPKHTEVIIEGQREVAETTGCAFFDAYAVMGGAGSFSRWRKHKPALTSSDGVHLTNQGNEIMGGWIYDAVMAGYAEAVPEPPAPTETQ